VVTTSHRTSSPLVVDLGGMLEADMRGRVRPVRVTRGADAMSRTEEAMLKRWSGAKIALGSLALGVAGVLPLLLYIAFGPADGNPIGLGLLMVVAVPLAALGVAIGLVKMLVERFARRVE
jgi:hypothetical protein